MKLPWASSMLKTPISYCREHECSPVTPVVVQDTKRHLSLSFFYTSLAFSFSITFYFWSSCSWEWGGNYKCRKSFLGALKSKSHVLGFHEISTLERFRLLVRNKWCHCIGLSSSLAESFFMEILIRQNKCTVVFPPDWKLRCMRTEQSLHCERWWRRCRKRLYHAMTILSSLSL